MSLDDLFGPQSGEPDEPRRPDPRPAPRPEPRSTEPTAQYPLLPEQTRPQRAPREPRGPREPGSRLPLILGIIAGVLLVAVIATLVFALNRGSGSPAPAPTTPPPSSDSAPAPPAPSPTASDEVGTPVALAFSGTGFTLVDDQKRTVFTFAWRDDVADAVEALTDAFGAAPTTRVEPGDGSHYPDYTVYQWTGFALYDMVESTGGATRAEYTQPTYVVFSRNEIGAITLTAEHGLSIGSSIADVRAASPDQEIPRGNAGAIRFVFDQDRSGTADGLAYSMFADTDGSAVTAILYYFYADL